MEIEKVMRCACHGPHFLSLSWDPSDPAGVMGAQACLSVEGAFHTSWLRRLRAAWGALRRGHADLGVDVVLDAGTAHEVSLALEEFSSYMRSQPEHAARVYGEAFERRLPAEDAEELAAGGAAPAVHGVAGASGPEHA